MNPQKGSKGSKTVVVCTRGGIEDEGWGMWSELTLHPSSAPTSLSCGGLRLWLPPNPPLSPTSSMFPAPSHSSSFPGGLLGASGRNSWPEIRGGALAGGRRRTHTPGTAPDSSSHELAGSVPSGAGEGHGAPPHGSQEGKGSLGKGQRGRRSCSGQSPEGG